MDKNIRIKKEKIKVYLQFPLGRSECTYYKYLVEYTPKEYSYINSEKSKGIIESKNKKKIFNFIKKFFRNLVRKLKLALPNAHLTITNKKYDLIHCAHCLSLNKKPWVCDIEWVGQFWISGNYKLHPNKDYVKKILASDNCKRILTWTQWAKRGILREFPELKGKVEVVYPGIPKRRFKKINSNDINLLFVARDFYFKGGPHAIEVIDRLTKKYKNVYGIVVSDIPKKVIKKYDKNKKMKFYKLMAQRELFKKIYPVSDILVYPSYTDTFGFGIAEALSFGIPVITVNGQSRKEIITNEKTGYVIREPSKWERKELNRIDTLKNTIDLIEKRTEELIKNPSLRKKMSKNCLEEIKGGRFSIKRRNKKLRKIYEEAIKEKIIKK